MVCLTFSPHPLLLSSCSVIPFIPVVFSSLATLGRYAGVSLVLVTHGLTLRIFLMKWFHWTVEEMLKVGVGASMGVWM